MQPPTKGTTISLNLFATPITKTGRPGMEFSALKVAKGSMKWHTIAWPNWSWCDALYSLKSNRPCWHSNRVSTNPHNFPLLMLINFIFQSQVARKMVKFIEMNSIGVSKDSQIRPARILKVIGWVWVSRSQWHRPVVPLGLHLLADRWQRLRRAVEASRRFSLSQFSNEFYEFSKEHAKTYPGNCNNLKLVL